MNLILLGPPGSGKGTQGAILSRRTGLVRVATGDLLRDAVKQGSELGLKAKGFMDRGELVPDEIILGLLEDVLSRPEAQGGVVMDGFPRTVVQAEKVDRLLADRGKAVDRVLLLSVPEEELLRRIMGRAKEEDRSDDTPEAFRRRVAVYREQTAPLVDYYRRRGILCEIDAVGTVEEVAGRIEEALKS
jgi:adenylate kinase